MSAAISKSADFVPTGESTALLVKPAHRRSKCPSFCDSITQKMKSASSCVFNAISELWGKKQPAFERKAGMWYQPGDEAKTGRFDRLMAPHSQRENWHKVSHYVAEFGCCLSNAGFFYVGYLYGEPLIALAGVASMASHAIPKDWLLTLDKTGAALAGIAIVRCYKTFIEEPWLFGPMAGVGGIFYADNFINAPMYHYNWPHELWHISGAYGCHLVFQASGGERAF